MALASSARRHPVIVVVICDIGLTIISTISQHIRKRGEWGSATRRIHLHGSTARLHARNIFAGTQLKRIVPALAEPASQIAGISPGDLLLGFRHGSRFTEAPATFKREQQARFPGLLFPLYKAGRLAAMQPPALPATKLAQCGVLSSDSASCFRVIHRLADPRTGNLLNALHCRLCHHAAARRLFTFQVNGRDLAGRANVAVSSSAPLLASSFRRGMAALHDGCGAARCS